MATKGIKNPEFLLKKDQTGFLLPKKEIFIIYGFYRNKTLRISLNRSVNHFEASLPWISISL